MREWGRLRHNDHSLWWSILGRNKASVTLDLRQAEGQHLASASFTAVPAAARVRAPFGITLSQERPGSSAPVITPFGGSTRSLPCQGRWRFDPDGPLAFLHGRRPLLSLHLRDTALRFG